MVDMAHIAGLVAGGQHMNPVPYADVVTTTTHKTLRGPRGGMILSRDEQFAKEAQQRRLPRHAGRAADARDRRQGRLPARGGAAGVQGLSPKTSSKTRRRWLRRCSQRGFDLVTGGTDNHLMLADLRKKNITGKDLQIKLDEVHITVNKNAIPNDPQKPGVTSGVRIGTPACTTRGFTEEDMPVVADCIDKIATDYDANREAVLAAVAALVKKHPIYE